MARRMTHGSAVRAIRTALGIRQNTLAEAAGIKPSYLCRIETGGETPAVNGTTRRLADRLGVGIDAITYPLSPGPHTDHRVTHGPAVRAIREALGIREDALAGAAGVSPRRLRSIEDGIARLGDGVVAQRLADRLGVDTDAITYPTPRSALEETA